MIRKLLAIVLFYSFLSAHAQKLYWVGGSGNWNDGQHWSLNSGGSPSGLSPNSSNDVVFDDRSTFSNLVITFVGSNSAKSLICNNEFRQIYFNGNNATSLRTEGDFILSRKTYFTANTKLYFSSVSRGTHTVQGMGNAFPGDVVFEQGGWNIDFLKVSDNSPITFLKGDYYFNSSSVTGGNIIANTGNVKISTNKGIISAKNKFELGSNVTMNATDLTVFANINNPNLFKIHPSVNTGSNSKFDDQSVLACSITYSFTNPSCNGLCDGSMTVNFVGCTGPYTVNFNTAATCIPSSTTGVMPPTLVLSNLCSCLGNLVDVIVKTGTVTVAALFSQNMPGTPTPIKLNNINSTMPLCFNGCNGSVDFDISGGTGPYSYTCNPPGLVSTGVFPLTTTVTPGLCAANHTFIVKDANACQVTSVVVVSQPPIIAPGGISTSITCNGFNNGTASVTPGGGTPGYTVNWSTGATNTTAVGSLSPGVVTASVTDANGCVQTYSTTITQPPALTVTPTQTNVSCGGLLNGQAAVTVTGGTPVYTYSWVPSSQTTSLAIGLSGVNTTVTIPNHTVTIRDFNGCVRTQTFLITQPPPITLTPTFTNITCNGLCNGSANANPTGGTPAFNFTWTAPGNIVVGNSQIVSGLCIGIYTVDVKDNLGCTKQATVQITQPPALTLTVNSTSVACNGFCNGTASAVVSGGTPAYTFTWLPGGAITPSLSALCAGNYSIQVKDSKGCPINTTFNIIQPTPILQNVTTVSVTCTGLCNGQVNTVPSGGTGPYTSTLTGASGTFTTVPPYSGLCAGIYTLTTKDASGCPITNTVNLLSPNNLTLSVVSSSLNCFGDCNASLSGSILGGNSPYTYTWTSSSSTFSTPIINGQCAGSYTFQAKDVNGCNTSTVVTITSPPDITVGITPTPPSCNGSCNGILTATVAGGVPGYTYNWSSPGSAGPIMNGLCLGNYTLTLNDTKGCIKTTTINLSAPLPIAVATSTVATSCSGSCDGVATATASGGTPGFTYQWNTVPVTTNTTGTVNGLCTGNYVVTVTDSKGCTGSANVFVPAPPVLSAAITGNKPSCNICIGASTVTAAGGTPGYTYSWTPSAQTTSVATNLCVGNYTVKVTDSKGCTATTTVNIAQTVLVVITTNGSTLSCNGGCSGIATANAAGGVVPYSYTWTPTAQTTSVAVGLCAGSYTVNVADNLGCSNTGTINFVNPAPIVVTSTVTNAVCNLQCNGAIGVTASGGTGAFSYTWSPGNPIGQGTPNVTNLCAGTYTLDIRDINGCPVQRTFTVTQPPTIASTFTATSPTACSGTNGSIVSTVSGGSPAYSYTWSPGGINTFSIGGIGAGTYSLVVKDAALCTTTLITTLSDPIGPTVTVTSNSILCNGSCSGTATVSAVGTNPLNYLWSAPISSTNTTVGGVCQGTFAINVTDGANCTTSQTFAIQQAPSFSVNAVVFNPLCSIVCNGSITTTPSGGTPGYSYTWTPGGSSAQNLTGICAGNYTAVVKDANNCSYTNTFSVTQPSTITITINKADVKCNGVCTGSVQAAAAGGTPPYSYTWTPVGSFAGSPATTIINLCANIYSVTATDSQGCSATKTVQITEPPLLTSTVVVRNSQCNGSCNGVATMLVGGGTPVYSYTWTAAGNITATLSGLCAGNYTGTVTDANGCSLSKSIVVTQPLPITVTVTPFNPTCNGVCNGTINTLASGGTGAYTYSWIPAGAGQNATGLCAGNYTVIVKDDSLCIGQNVAALINPPKLLANVSFTNPPCAANCNGIAISTPSNAVGAPTFTWTNSVPLVISNTNSASSLCPGNYTVIVKDTKGCRDTQAVTLTTPPALTINPAVAAAACGVCNGSITVTGVGGTPAYSYNWAAPVSSTNAAVANLCAGIYTVTVTDANNCSNIFSIPLSNSNGPSGSTITFTNVTCNGLCNGVGSVTNPVGGTPGYTVTWVTPSSTVMPLSGLCAGNYTAQIKDAAGCLLFQSLSISQPAVLTANSTTSLPLCNGICNGSITSTPMGGNPTYTFSWSTGAVTTGTTSSVTSLCTGNYTLNITDTKGCAMTQTYSMPATTSIVGNTVAVNNICSGNCNGSILAAAVAGGLPPYTFNWSDPLGQSNAQATGLCNGNYFVIIKDFNGCFDTLKSTITSPAPITLTSSIVQPTCGLCNGTSTVGAIGGTAPFTYSWSSGATGISASNLCAGLYMISITDNAGCAQNVSITVNNSSTLNGTVTATNETCFGLCNGTASVTASGGTPGYTYNWISPAAATNTLNSLCGGIYFVQIKDAVGCLRTQSVTIASATNLSVTPFITQPTCPINNNGSISTNVTGGGGPLTYNWQPGGATTSSITNIPAGTYTLTVSDGTCNKTNVFTVANQNAPILASSTVSATCNGTCNAAASVTVSAGASPYTFNWSSGTVASGATTSTASNLCGGIITVTVTDNNTCKAIQTVTLTQPPPIVTSLPIVAVPKCNGNCNGSIAVVASGGTLPYVYNWSPAGSTNPLINLCAGNYSSTITDAKGCSVVKSFTLIDPPPFGLVAGVQNSSCNTLADGAITTTVTGGIPAYTFTWTGPAAFTSTASALNNILSGTYSLTLIDFAGCRKDTAMKVISTVTVIANAGKDTVFCANGLAMLNGSLSIGANTYQWLQLTSGGGTVSISNTVTASAPITIGASTFVLIASNGACVSSDSIKITANPAPFVDAGPDVSIPVYSSTGIGGSPTALSGSTFTWSPAATIDLPNTSNPIASNTVNTTYTVTITDVNGCVASDTMHVIIYPQIIIPNGFSPNADGKNDSWMLDNIQQFPDCTVEIFNRWGEPLFYSKGYATNFDGKYKGKDLPVGTYYYIINLNHEAFPKAYTGPLTIFR